MTFDTGSMRARLRVVGRQMREDAAAGLRDAAEHVMGVAKDQVPHETGVLQNSGKVYIDEENLTAVLSFDTPYAVRQHEDMTARHDPGRNAKYLEGPLRTEAETARALIERRLTR